uniref:Uncharacterized protein n=1 Tax=Theropithecus gelada TaxID=9565 RepID=A0A8D2GAC3_THEGE
MEASFCPYPALALGVVGSGLRPVCLVSCRAPLHAPEGPTRQPWLFRRSLAAETPAKSSVLVVGIVIGVLLLTAAAVGGALLWRRMRSGLPAPWISLRGDDTGSLLPTPGEAQDADSKDINVIPTTA